MAHWAVIQKYIGDGTIMRVSLLGEAKRSGYSWAVVTWNGKTHECVLCSRLCEAVAVFDLRRARVLLLS